MTTTSPAAPSADLEEAPVRKLYRSAEGRWLGGVAQGLAGHLAVPVSWVRVAFVALTLASGGAGLMYGVFWFVVPLGTAPLHSTVQGRRPPPGTVPHTPLPGVPGTPDGPPAAPGAPPHPAATGPATGPDHERARQDGTEAGTTSAGETPPTAGPSATATGHGRRSRQARRAELLRTHRGQAVALAMLAAGIVAFFQNVQFEVASDYLWPLLLITIGAAVVWRQADDSRRAHWSEASRKSRWLPLVRTLAGGLLVLTGVVGFVLAQGTGEDLSRNLQAALAVLVGFALLSGPFVVRVVQDLSEERTMRIRAQERAEVAAHIHDSVLHTLTLIQRNSADSREVARLARAQERDLRSWLHRSAESPGGPAGMGTADATEEEESRTLADGVRRTAAEVEDYHGVPIEVVCVGDCPLDDQLTAQLQAAREAMVNAAKYGGEDGPVSVFAEVEGRTVFLSVRDRGPGFDLDAVPNDRMGVRESIIGRMQRNGGRARVRVVPSGGTEVELTMERTDDR